VNEPISQKIPFQVDLSRIIEVLAKQIYQDPLALLRENTQNAFDAIRLRTAGGDVFDPQILVDITPTTIAISDNGIGMTPQDLKDHYWRAGASSKNTPEAKAAGVVGTFGIGAMANFGIAEELVVETESSITGERTRSSARRDTLSTTEDTIFLTVLPSTGRSGTTVTVTVSPAQAINVAVAGKYISDFVAYIDIPVRMDGQTISLRDLGEAVPEIGEPVATLSEHELSANFTGDLALRVARTGEVWVQITNISYRGIHVGGRLIFRQSTGAIRTYRSGFGLATVGVRSQYSLGGAADLTILQPTAGREALTTESMQLLQSIVAGVDTVISLEIAKRPEADSNTQFMEWVRRNGRFDLCGNLLARIEPDSERVALDMLKAASEPQRLLVYSGSDLTMINAAATDDSRLVVLAASQPRRQCEQEYLTRYCRVETLDDAPTVLEEKPKSAWSNAEQAFAFRIASVLATDYFLNADVTLGSLSHGLPIVVDSVSKPVRVILDPASATFALVCALFADDYTAFGSMTKDYIRNIIFPRIADLVPSSTRQGAEAFLKSIRRTRDVFEYEYGDLDNLNSVWQEYVAGRLTMSEAASRSSLLVSRNVQVVDSGAALSVRDVVPDVVDNEIATAAEPLGVGPAPPILRMDIASEAKLLTIDSSDAPLKGYRCFIALSDRAREERGEFFLQPHGTSVVWGGQKVLFVFEHHSGEFGLYYDLQTAQIVADTSGGGPFPTATIVLRNRIFIPVPEVIASAFIPSLGERKRFEVRCDLLYTDAR
jgi:molecular chaperone HtpG